MRGDVLVSALCELRCPPVSTTHILTPQHHSHGCEIVCTPLYHQCSLSDRRTAHAQVHCPQLRRMGALHCTSSRPRIHASLPLTAIRTVPDVQWLSAVPFGFILATDAILTGSLIYWLHRSRTGFQEYVPDHASITSLYVGVRSSKQSCVSAHGTREFGSTDSLLNVLIVYTINTGTPPSFLSAPLPRTRATTRLPSDTYAARSAQVY